MDFLERYPAITHYLFALSSLGIGVGHYVAHAHPFWILLAETVVPLLLSVGIGYAGRRFERLDPSARHVLRSAVVLCAGYLYGAGFVAFIEALQTLAGATPMGTQYLILVGGFGGVAMATIITHFHVAYDQRLAELRDQTERATRLQKQVSVLNRTLRHNIRNELSIIEGWLDEALTGEEDSAEEARERVLAHLDELEELSDTARRIQEVLSEETRTTMDVTDCIDKGAERIQSCEPAVDVSTEQTEPVVVEAHPDLEMAIRETFANAVEHNDPEDLEIAVSIVEDAEHADSEDWCRIDITDTGGGIPAVEVEALENVEETRLTHGVGLGLYLIKAVVEQSGGEVEIKPCDSGGTTVRMWLPKADAESLE
ncbi:sensor histidine kinase [Haloparvum sp. AD34]